MVAGQHVTQMAGPASEEEIAGLLQTEPQIDSNRRPRRIVAGAALAIGVGLAGVVAVHRASGPCVPTMSLDMVMQAYAANPVHSAIAAQGKDTSALVKWLAESAQNATASNLTTAFAQQAEAAMHRSRVEGSRRFGEEGRGGRCEQRLGSEAGGA